MRDRQGVLGVESTVDEANERFGGKFQVRSRGWVDLMQADPVSADAEFEVV